MFGKVGGLHRERDGMLVYSFEDGVQAVLQDRLAYIEVKERERERERNITGLSCA